MQAKHLVILLFGLGLISNVAVASTKRALLECNAELGDKFSHALRQEIGAPDLEHNHSVMFLIRLPRTPENPPMGHTLFFELVKALKELDLEIGRTTPANDGSIYMTVTGKTSSILEAAKREDVVWVESHLNLAAENQAGPDSQPVSSNPPSVTDYAGKILDMLRSGDSYVAGFNGLSLKEIEGKKTIVIYVENLAAIKRIEPKLVEFGVPIRFEMRAKELEQLAKNPVVQPRLREALKIASPDSELEVTFAFESPRQKLKFMKIVHSYDKVRTGYFDRPDSGTFVLIVYAKPYTIRALLKQIPQGTRWADLVPPRKPQRRS